MKKIHIGSKINLVEVPELESGNYYNKFDLIMHDTRIQHAIDNPIAEFVDDLDFIRHFLGEGLHDIPEGYRVEVSETCKWNGNMDACANETCWDLNECQHNPKIASLKEEN